MIKIEREEPPKNTALDKKRDTELQRIKELVESGELKSEDFNEKLWSGKVKRFLHKSQHGKCCYCERKRDKGETDVEHFRPKARVKEAGEGHHGYWWLAYDWENLLIACKKCNQKKGTRFPLKDEKKRVYEKGYDLGEEEPLLINPLEKDPELFIDYDLPSSTEDRQFMIKAIGRCEVGKKTVNELTGINDEEVMLERADKFEICYDVWADLKDSGNDKLRLKADKRLRKHISPNSGFSGFAKFYFKKQGCL